MITNLPTRSTLRDALAISLVWLALSPSLLAWWGRGLLRTWAGLLEAAGDWRPE